MVEQVFDSQAMSYDAVAESALGVELRARVHDVVAKLITSDSAVADLGCGTGIDTAWLAPQVGSVLAIDAAAEMVALTSLRSASLANVSVTQGNVAATSLPVPVDLALANFGVVNCVGDLGEFGRTLADMLVPGGMAVVVSMPRWCPIELGVGLVGRNRSLLTRRQPGPSSEAAYDGLHLTYASTNDLAEAFAPNFDLEHAEALGVFLPPFEQRSWVENRSRLRNGLALVDRRFGSIGAKLGLGDHHIAVFRRRS